MRLLVVDSLAAVVFFGLLAGWSELFIARMSWEQVLASRLAAIPVTLLTGRPYGLWRDAILRIGATGHTRRWRLGLLDVTAFLSFQVPVYIAILTFAGASPDQMLRAVPTASFLMLLASRPYGLYLEYCRKLAGLSPVGTS